nr:MAG TPA_asm: hypothetical protein [Caudoviricetes sp.]
MCFLRSYNKKIGQSLGLPLMTWWYIYFNILANCTPQFP